MTVAEWFYVTTWLAISSLLAFATINVLAWWDRDK